MPYIRLREQFLILVPDDIYRCLFFLTYTIELIMLILTVSLAIMLFGGGASLNAARKKPAGTR
ncbi:MAG: hypothetical protein SFV52_07530 [Saprospiraceae bacterium]|nr:hypothetical protein [Saprospiraceae bacterium]